MDTNPNTEKNSPQREFTSTVHPSGFETSGFPIFEPNRQQIESAARRAQDDPMFPRPRLYPARFVLFAILIAALVYLATYFVLSRVLG